MKFQVRVKVAACFFTISQGMLMGHYSFSSPILAEIHDSYARMNRQIDQMISLFNSLFYSTNPPRSNPMETKDVVVHDLTVSSFPLSLEEIQEKEFEYSDAVLYRPFSEFDTPVFDSEGMIREKGQKRINKSIYTNNPVTIIESTDLKKIKNDQRTLETKFDEMREMFIRQMSKLDYQDKRIDNLIEINAQKDKKIEDFIEMMKQKDKKIEEQKKEFDTALEEQNIKFTKAINTLNNTVNSLNKTIDSLNKTVSHLEKTVETQQQEILQLRTENQELKEKMALQPIPLVTERMKSPPARPSRGFLDTIAYPAECREHKRNQENLKEAAAKGNVDRLQEVINAGNLDINGRGMPDSLCTILKGYGDKTALMLAVSRGHTHCVKILIENGANPNFLDRENFTALDYAQQNFHKGIADFLKQKGGFNGADLLPNMAQYKVEKEVNSFHMMEYKPIFHKSQPESTPLVKLNSAPTPKNTKINLEPVTVSKKFN